MTLTPHREKELREDWGKSELAKRIDAVEMFAIKHNFPQWTKETIPDYWLTIIKSEINKVLEGVEKDVHLGAGESEHAYIRTIEIKDIINKYKQ